MKFRLGRRFLFAVVADICMSIVTIVLKYPADFYYKMLLAIAGIFTLGQTVTDYKNGKQNEGEPK